ncbi:Acyl-coenzyme A thioesterase 9, mitochondrial [Physocladia obscura]|uniref:Acyl-coenzyme A thioesterase 9, mitochondrial n=1 Tax=Physocladia obscura TaxID=109957 RepID=A0AAD5T0T8_9FUNG|nr:Acyl-coenzyme A thioesterase 9, mitochondrial [Physocladia obscura]
MTPSTIIATSHAAVIRERNNNLTARILSVVTKYHLPNSSTNFSSNSVTTALRRHLSSKSSSAHPVVQIPKVLPELKQHLRFNDRITYGWNNTGSESDTDKRLEQQRTPLSPLAALQTATAAAVNYSTVVEKSMADSFLHIFLPFRSDLSLKDEYLNLYGRIRVGKVLEDLDALAGSIASLHNDGSERPLSVVTASIDRISLLREIPIDKDISIYGNVTYVGKTSMEVTVHMETVSEDSNLSSRDIEAKKYLRTKLPKQSGDLIMAAKFIMVAVDTETQKPAQVFPLRLETEQERAIFRRGREHKARKQLTAQSSLPNHPPSPTEMALVHSIYREYATSTTVVPKPKNIVWMHDTLRHSFNLTFPQDRNIHNKIFGGHLIRLAFELAYVSATVMARQALQFVAMDDVLFKIPVPVGAVLDMVAQVAYTRKHDGAIVVKVLAHVVDAATGAQELSNEFWLTFRTIPLSRNIGTSEDWVRVIPRSYDECMLYLEGKRRLTD